jgi:HlyD family secretion protein
MRKLWLLGIGVLLVGAAVFAYLKLDTKQVASAAVVSTTRVTKGTIEVNVSGTGSLAPADKVTVKSNDTGTIDKINVAVGDKVKKGDVLATIEGADNADKIDNEKVDLESKILDLEDTQQKFKTLTDDSSIESLKISLKKQQLSINQSRTTIAELQKEEVGSTITATISGTITAVSAAAGDSVNLSSTIAEIANYDSLEIVVGIDELDISQVKLGQTAAVTVEALDNKEYVGKVIAIADEGTSSNGVATFDVTIALDTSENLKSGMSAEASIQVEKKENVLMLPIDAVQSVGNRYMVMLPTGSTASTQTGNAQAAGGQPSAPAGNAPAGNAPTAGQGADATTAAPTGGAPAAGQAANRTGGRTRGGYGGGQGGYGGQGGFRAGQGGYGGYGGSQRGTTRTGTASGVGSMQIIKVGVHNEDYIEIVSGLTEGQSVVVPTVLSSTTKTTGQQGFGGIGGFGGIAGGAGGFPSGGGQGGRGGQGSRGGQSGGGTR